MNRYQQEIAEMGRRHSLYVAESASLRSSRRAPVALGVAAAGIIAAAMWGASVRNDPMSARLKRDDTAAESQSQVAKEHVSPATLQSQGSSKPAERRLHLVATSPGRNASEGTAALGPDIANPRVMSAGALLENGAVLREIHSDHVVLERDGKRTDLYIEGAAINTRTKHRSSENSELLALAQGPPSIRKPVSASPATYTEILRGAPHYSENECIGFDVYPGTSSGQFSRLGLRPGDVLAAVDGVPIRTHEALANALRDLSEGRSVVASVVRAGQPVELALDGAVLTQNASAVASAGPMPPP